MKDLDKYRGCLIGGAAGDALGYAVEFLEDSQIFERYGEYGITEYALENGLAPISDDTQMTLFTANGLLLGTTRGIIEPYPSYIGRCYQDWYKTQTTNAPLSQPEHSWLNNLPEMNHRRAPGITCLQALENGRLGSVDHPVNRSKGCGGIMRVAPIGLYFEYGSADEVDLIGAEAAALTHGHELGYIPAAMLVHMIHLLVHGGAACILAAVKGAMDAAKQLFPAAVHLQEMLNLADRAIALSSCRELDDLEAIRALGQGWVAEETLAIAIYCALKYEDDFEQAIIAAVNHSGDSDSTGAVTGNLLGAHLGLKAIPQKFLTHLELRDTIMEIADDLYNDYPISESGNFRHLAWKAKYITHTYPHS